MNVSQLWLVCCFAVGHFYHRRLVMTDWLMTEIDNQTKIKIAQRLFLDAP